MKNILQLTNQRTKKRELVMIDNICKIGESPSGRVWVLMIGNEAPTYYDCTFESIVSTISNIRAK